MTSGPQSTTLRLFGAGGAFSRRYGTTCSMITLPSGLRWLIDCGRQAPDQICAAGLRWHDIEGQIITHVHGDHVFGLEDFAFVRYYEGHRGLRSVREGGSRPKFIAHTAVQAEVWETLGPALRYLPGVQGNPAAGTLGHYFEIIDVHGYEPARTNPWRHAEAFECGELRLTAREADHVPGKPATSLEIAVSSDAHDDRIAWWSGDSTVNVARLVAIEPRTSILFHDCTFVEYPGQVHGSFALLESLPEPVRNKLVLMHHEDDIERHRQRAEARGFRLAMPGDVYDLATGQRVGGS